LRWNTPKPGQQIAVKRILSPAGADSVFNAWARRTFAKNWETVTQRASREIKEAMKEWDAKRDHVAPQNDRPSSHDAQRQISEMTKRIGALEKTRA
jgi:hypothetical protein